MQGNIEKTAKNINNYRKKVIFYQNARTGFSEILKFLKEKYNDFTLLLPAFIGYSPREGSGIYDPIVENGINHKFYLIDENINILMEDYIKTIKETKNKIVLLLVHYFGYVDKNIKEILRIARENNSIIIEDCAHALYTDYIDNSCGQFADVSIYSLHKMLPYENGGMIRINTEEIKLEDTNYFYNIMEYDLKSIAKKRKKNADIIEKELSNVRGIKLLRPVKEYKKQTPQTYPILIEGKDKNDLYYQLNENGFGVVSLYHTMINNLDENRYKTSNYIAKRILNLPVHQDAQKEMLYKMCKMIKELMGDCDEK